MKSCALWGCAISAFSIGLFAVGFVWAVGEAQEMLTAIKGFLIGSP